MGLIGQTNFYYTEVTVIITSMQFLLHNLKQGIQQKGIWKMGKQNGKTLSSFEC